MVIIADVDITTVLMIKAEINRNGEINRAINKKLV